MVDISGLNSGQKIISFLSKVDTSRNGKLDATEIDKAVEQGLISIDDAKALKAKMGPDGLLDAKELMQVVEEKKKDSTVFSELQENEAAAVYEPHHNIYETILRGGVTVYLFGSDTAASVLAKPTTITINGKQTTLPAGTEVRIENGKIASFVTPNQANGARVEVQLANGRVAVPAGTEVTIVNGKVKSLNIPSDARMVTVGAQTVAWDGIKAPRNGEYSSTTSALAAHFVTNTDVPIILDNGIEGPGRSVVRFTAVADPDGQVTVSAEVRQTDGSWKKADNLDLRQILKQHYGRETQPNTITVALNRLSQIPNLPHPTSTQPMAIDLRPLAISISDGLPSNRRTTEEAKGVAEHLVDLHTVASSSSNYFLRTEVEEKTASLEKAVAEYNNATPDQREAKLANLNKAISELLLVFQFDVKPNLNPAQQAVLDQAEQLARIAKKTKETLEIRRDTWEAEKTASLKDEFPRVVDHHTNNLAELTALVQTPATTRFARFNHPAITGNDGIIKKDSNTRRLIGQRAVSFLTTTTPGAADLAAANGPLKPYIQEYLPANQRLLTFTHEGKNYAAVVQQPTGDGNWQLVSGSLPPGTALGKGDSPIVYKDVPAVEDRPWFRQSIPVTGPEHIAAQGKTPVASFREPTLPVRPAPTPRSQATGGVVPEPRPGQPDVKPEPKPVDQNKTAPTPRTTPRQPAPPKPLQEPPVEPRQPAFDPNLPMSFLRRAYDSAKGLYANYKAFTDKHHVETAAGANYVVPNDAVVDKSGGNVRRISIPATSSSTMTFTVQEDNGPKTYTLHPNETLYFDGTGHPTHRVFYGDGVQQTGRFATNEARAYFGEPATPAPVKTPVQPTTTRVATLREPTLDEIGMVSLSDEEKITADTTREISGRQVFIPAGSTVKTTSEGTLITPPPGKNIQIGQNKVEVTSAQFFSNNTLSITMAKNTKMGQYSFKAGDVVLFGANKLPATVNGVPITTATASTTPTAQPKPATVASGYGYEFGEDPLAAGGFGPNDASVRVRPGPVRTTLIRDRNTFAAPPKDVAVASNQVITEPQVTLDLGNGNNLTLPPGTVKVDNPSKPNEEQYVMGQNTTINRQELQAGDILVYDRTTKTIFKQNSVDGTRTPLNPPKVETPVPPPPPQPPVARDTAVRPPVAPPPPVRVASTTGNTPANIFIIGRLRNSYAPIEAGSGKNNISFNYTINSEGKIIVDENSIVVQGYRDENAVKDLIMGRSYSAGSGINGKVVSGATPTTRPATASFVHFTNYSDYDYNYVDPRTIGPNDPRRSDLTAAFSQNAVDKVVGAYKNYCRRIISRTGSATTAMSAPLKFTVTIGQDGTIRLKSVDGPNADLLRKAIAGDTTNGWPPLGQVKPPFTYTAGERKDLATDGIKVEGNKVSVTVKDSGSTAGVQIGPITTQ